MFYGFCKKRLDLKVIIHFKINSNFYKQPIEHRVFREDNQKVPRKRNDTHYCLDSYSAIKDWDFAIFGKCKTDVQLKQRKTFWLYRLKNFYNIYLNEKEEYFYCHKSIPH